MICYNLLRPQNRFLEERFRRLLERGSPDDDMNRNVEDYYGAEAYDAEAGGAGADDAEALKKVLKNKKKRRLEHARRRLQRQAPRLRKCVVQSAQYDCLCRISTMLL